MTRALAAVRSFFGKREPLRRRIYSALVVVLAAAVATGYLTGEEAAAITGTACSLLVIPAAEMARSQVSPTRPAKHRAKR